MAQSVISVRDDTKDRFDSLVRETAVKRDEDMTHDKMVTVLMDSFEGDE